MIQANELRIGNLVLMDGKEVGIISEIRSNHSKVIYQGEVNGNISTRFSLIEFIRLEPIPLTEEWLVRFGFRKTFDSPFEDFEWSDNNLQLSEKFDCYLGKFTQPIKYVHNLQNLYFALTGEELKLTENDTH